MIIGVSGKSGCGKSSVCKYIEKNYGFKWIDTDKIAKKIRDENSASIIDIVGDNSVLSFEGIDSKKLGSILFENKKILDNYNVFIYSKLKEYLDKEVKKYDNVVVDSMFLPVMDVFAQCKYKILIVCEDEKRKTRIVKRDKISVEYFEKRDSNSLSYQTSDFDFIIVNNGRYRKQIINIMNQIKINL